MRSRIALYVLLPGTLIVMSILFCMNGRHEDAYGFSFPDLQNAKNEDHAREILDAWKGDAAVKDIKNAMRVDLVFPFFYAPLLALICLRASANASSGWVTVAGMIAAAIAILGGIGDLLENKTMLDMVGHPDLAGQIKTVMNFRYLKEGGLVTAQIYALLAHFNAR